MRLIQHWKIGKDCMGRYSSLAFQLGTILPDWFERKTMHRIDESLDLILNRLNIISRMPEGIKRDFMLGTVVHFITDYCCFAHVGNHYNNWIVHRIYEVKSQKLYCNQDTYNYILNMDNLYNKFIQEVTLTDNMYINIEIYLHYIKNRLQYRYITPNMKWYRDTNIMNTDIIYAYNMVYGILMLLGEFDANKLFVKGGLYV